MSHKPKDAIVWTEVPVSNMKNAIDFYNRVFQFDLQLDETGPNPMAVFPTKDPKSGVAGHLYPGKPAAGNSGPTLHFAVPDSLEAATKRCAAAGGEILMGPIEIPNGRFTYARDPDGNSIGLFEGAG